MHVHFNCLNGVKISKFAIVSDKEQQKKKNKNNQSLPITATNSVYNVNDDGHNKLSVNRIMICGHTVT